MQLSDRFQVNPKIVNATIDGEVIMLNLERGRYYSLTACGAETWGAIERGASAGEILDHLGARYDAPPSEIQRALMHLLDDLRQEELILPRNGSGGRADSTGERAAPASAPAERLPFEPPLLQAYTDMEDLLLLDPIHDVDGTGWPNRRPDDSPLDG